MGSRSPMMPAIAQGVSTSVIPALPPDQGEPFWLTPQTEQIDFTGYVTGEKFHDPRIMVFPVNEYKAINPGAGEIITKLQQYISNKPTIPAGSIPFLPGWNAAQLFSRISGFCILPKWTGHPFPGRIRPVFGAC